MVLYTNKMFCDMELCKVDVVFHIILKNMVGSREAANDNITEWFMLD